MFLITKICPLSSTIAQGHDSSRGSVNRFRDRQPRLDGWFMSQSRGWPTAPASPPDMLCELTMKKKLIIIGRQTCHRRSCTAQDKANRWRLSSFFVSLSDDRDLVGKVCFRTCSWECLRLRSESLFKKLLQAI